MNETWTDLSIGKVTAKLLALRENILCRFHRFPFTFFHYSEVAQRTSTWLAEKIFNSYDDKTPETNEYFRRLDRVYNPIRKIRRKIKMFCIEKLNRFHFSKSFSNHSRIYLHIICNIYIYERTSSFLSFSPQAFHKFTINKILSIVKNRSINWKLSFLFVDVNAIFSSKKQLGPAFLLKIS